jgi:hypothetical protein
MLKAVMPARITSEKVWREIRKRSFAVLAFVTPKSEARSAGIVYTARDRDIYIATDTKSWKTRHITQNPHVSLTVTIPKRIPFMPWLQIPPATITFQGEASIHDARDVPLEIQRTLLRGLDLGGTDAPDVCIIRVRPRGEFVTYGVGVPLLTMRKPEAARGRAPV